MNPLIAQMLPQVIERLKKDKGLKGYRGGVALLLLLIWHDVSTLEKRVAVIEAAHRPGMHASASTNSVASVGPHWPAQTAAAFQ